ncbi:MAG: DNA/pantothenate metabolism flavoprotein domain protein [Verrucomicrobiae bacterium]|nr:DNA/pantothenate metabolism flavoprotein domain protein [Verrucomicrobiae bacterium]MDW7980492.1 phosphopantothenoylcysteine decarboxylase [Verrucomicrobiales bacterium]
MRCVVTAGPTFEPLDQVRRLTNFSTGRLGTELARYLAARGHDVTLLIGQQAGAQVRLAQAAAQLGEHRIQRVEIFSTTSDLSAKLAALASEPIAAVFHAAAVSDFAFGKVWVRTPEGEFIEARRDKIPTELGTVLAELVPTPKLIARLREWFPNARLVGWKYEVEGTRAEALKRAKQQIDECRTDACVANGPAYGAGFGLVLATGQVAHLPGESELFERLEFLIRT